MTFCHAGVRCRVVSTSPTSSATLLPTLSSSSCRSILRRGSAQVRRGPMRSSSIVSSRGSIGMRLSKGRSLHPSSQSELTSLIEAACNLLIFRCLSGSVILWTQATLTTLTRVMLLHPRSLLMWLPSSLTGKCGTGSKFEFESIF